MRRVPATLVLLISLHCLACSAHQFVQNGRKTILTIEEANAALDGVAEAWINDPEHDDPKYDKTVDQLVCAVTITDAILLDGWRILYMVEIGPPKLSPDDAMKWMDWAERIIAHLATVYEIVKTAGVKVDGIEKALDALSFIVPIPDNIPDDLECAP